MLSIFIQIFVFIIVVGVDVVVISVALVLPFFIPFNFSVAHFFTLCFFYQYANFFLSCFRHFTIESHFPQKVNNLYYYFFFVHSKIHPFDIFCAMHYSFRILFFPDYHNYNRKGNLVETKLSTKKTITQFRKLCSPPNIHFPQTINVLKF